MRVGSLWSKYYGRFAIVLPNGYEINSAEGIAKWADAKVRRTVRRGNSIVAYI